MHNFKAEIEVLAESSGRHFISKVAIARGDDSHIDFPERRTPDPLHYAILYDAQQLSLHFRRQFGDFIEEQRALVGRLKNSLPVAGRSCECSLYVAQEIAFSQRRRNSRAVNRHQPAMKARTQPVNQVSKLLLPGPCFAQEKNG